MNRTAEQTAFLQYYVRINVMLCYSISVYTSTRKVISLAKTMFKVSTSGKDSKKMAEIKTGISRTDKPVCEMGSSIFIWNYPAIQYSQLELGWVEACGGGSSVEFAYLEGHDDDEADEEDGQARMMIDPGSQEGSTFKKTAFLSLDF